MSEDWDFNYAMQRASVDSYAKHIWYAIETVGNTEKVYLLKNENEVFNLRFNKNTDHIEVGYTPNCLLFDKSKIPAKRKAVVAVYFIDGSFKSIDEATQSLHTSIQELKFNSYAPNSELAVLKQAVSDYAVGIIKGKSETCIARESIHNLATLSENGKITNIKSIQDIVNSQNLTDVLNHFTSLKNSKNIANVKKSA